MAASKMNLHDLKKDELEYELTVRGIGTAGLGVDDMRASLRPLLRLERTDRSVSYSPVTFIEADALDAIGTKYAELEAAAAALADDTTGRANTRLASRGLHLLGRVNRIPIKAGETELIEKRGTWLAKVSALLGRLPRMRPRSDGVNMSSTMVEPRTSLLTANEEPVEEEDDDDDSLPEQNASCSYNAARGRRIPVYKWNVTFTGEPGSISVMDFLERVSELRRARGYTEDELHQSALDLFQGKALLWYRSAGRRTRTWVELVDLLKRHYLPPDYRSRLFGEILSRTQGQNEPIVEYLACMQALVDRYGTMSREVLLDVVRRNLAPFYTMQLPDVHSLEDLEAECLKLETKKYRAEHYHAPPRKNKDCVEPELACLASRLDEVTVAEAPREPQTRTKTVRPGVRCYNCDRLGHIARFCPQSRPRPSGNGDRRN